MSAQIIQHPRAASERVIQTRGPGRHPKSIASFYDANFKRKELASNLRTISREVEVLIIYLELNQHLAKRASHLLATLRRADVNPSERVVLAQRLRDARQGELECWTGQEVVIASEFVRWSEGLPSRLQ